MKRLTPLAKGLITAAVILGLTLFIYYTTQPPDTKLNYLIYIVYAAGIIWTLIEYHLYINGSAKFGELFGQGFRCFIVVTLIMVVFTGVFTVAHPEFAERDAKNFRNYLFGIKDTTDREGTDSRTNRPIKDSSTVSGKTDSQESAKKDTIPPEVANKTPAEKEEMVANYKKQYTTQLIYTAILGYLILGSIFNAVGSAFIALRRK